MRFTNHLKACLVLGALLISSVSAQTVVFEKPDNVDWNDSSAYIDSITANVGITRDYSGPLFNGFTETGAEAGSPEGTLWMYGPTPKTATPVTYGTFDAVVGEEKRKYLPGRTLSLFLTADSLFFDVYFTSWSQNQMGGFAYERTPAEKPIFDQSDENTVYYTNWNEAADDSANYDWITDSVAIWRGDTGPIYNAALEVDFQSGVSPVKTLWARGATPAEASPLYYSVFDAIVPSGTRSDLPGQTLSLYLPDEELFFDIEWTSWTSGGGGGFSYIRRTATAPIWTGDPNTIHFRKHDHAEFDSVNFDWITDSVALWRNNNDRLFNAVDETNHTDGVSPTRTRWARGPTPDAVHPFHYRSFDEVYSKRSEKMRDIPGQTLSLFIPEDSLYFDVRFQDWTSGRNGGGFAYARTPVDKPTIQVEPDMVYYYKSGGMDPADTSNWDWVSDSVAIIRGFSGALYNPLFETAYQKFSSPARTRWAAGPTAEQERPWDYVDFQSAAGGSNSMSEIVGKTLSMYLTDSDEYFDVTFFGWGQGGEAQGSVAYMRKPVPAPTLTSDPNSVYYVKPPDAVGDSADWDWISDSLALYRGSSGPIYNAALETGVESTNSPLGTLWAMGPTPTDADPFTYAFTYAPFQSTANRGNRKNLPGQVMSLMVIGATDTSFFDIEWVTWSSRRTGGFSYVRTPAPAPVFHPIDDDPGWTYFIKSANTNPFDSTGHDQLSDSVALSSLDHLIFNPILETGPQNYFSPARTMWAMGPTSDQEHVWEYTDLQSAMGSEPHIGAHIGKTMSLYLPDDSLYFDIKWLHWAEFGGFAYKRKAVPAPELVDDPLAVYFIKPAGSDPADTANWDILADSIAITRGNDHPIFNPLQETGFSNYISPVGTQWAIGPTAGQTTPLAYASFSNVVSRRERRNLPGKTLSLYLPDSQKYYDVRWVTWTPNRSGGFSYVRKEVPAPEFQMDPNVVHFIKHDYADWVDSVSQDRITDKVWITRSDNRPIFNAFMEDGFEEGNERDNPGSSPLGTQWAYGPTEAQQSLFDYSNFGHVVGPGQRKELPGKIMSLYIPEDDLYFDIEWLTWTMHHDGGGFSYRRTSVDPPTFSGDINLVQYVKADSAKMDSIALWDHLTDSVAIFRGYSGPLYNPILEMEHESGVSPAKTLWAKGLTNHVRSPNQYQVFDILVDEDLKYLPGKIFSLWLPEDSLFFDVKFRSWTKGSTNGGGFAYIRRPAETPESFKDSTVVYFSKDSHSDYRDARLWDWLSGNVAITRGETKPIYNGAMESEYNSSKSPVGTRWFVGPTDEVRHPGAYQPFGSVVGSGMRRELPGKTLSLFVLEDSSYYDVTWISWDQDGDGGFSYIRKKVDEPQFEVDPDAVFFSKPDESPNVLPYMDKISDDVILTRGDNGPIFNFVHESEFIWGRSPTNTLWTYGPTSEVKAKGQYQNFDVVVEWGQRRELPGKLMSLYLPEEDRYFDIEWFTWSRGGGDGNRGFSYLRTEVPAPDYEIDPDAIFFEQADGADPMDPANWDQISEHVAITRGNYGGPIFNPHTENEHIQNQSPTGTLWAYGHTGDIVSPAQYDVFDMVVTRGTRRELPGKVMSLYLPDEDRYYDVQWVSWTRGRDPEGDDRPSGSGGGFSYYRKEVAPPIFLDMMGAVFFQKSVNSDSFDPRNQDHISDNVAITSGNFGSGIYNAHVDLDGNEAAAPTGTRWAIGRTSDQMDIGSYQSFRATFGDGEREDRGDIGSSLPGMVTSLYVPEINAFFDIYWMTWVEEGRGFSYLRIPAGHLNKAAEGDWMDPANQDRVNDDVILTRLSDGGVLFNAVTETGPVNKVSPEGTLWAVGPTAEQQTKAAYVDFKSSMAGKMKNLPGMTLSMYLTEANLYYDVKFVGWGSGSSGSVEYFRSWSEEPTFMSQAPDSFMVHPVTDPVLLTYENLDTDTLTLGWDETTDPNLDTIKYRVVVTLEIPTQIAFIDTTIDQALSLDIAYHQIANALLAAGVYSGDLTWTVYATDGQHEVMATNSPQTVVVDGLVLDVHSSLELPESFTVEQNYPNPFNPTTAIRFGIPEQSDVQMFIFDIRGRVVQNVEFHSQPAGWYEYMWNGTNVQGHLVSTGVYFCRIQAGPKAQTIKMVYLK